MTKLIHIPLYCLMAILSLCALMVFFGVGNKPEVIGLGWSLTHDDIARARKILLEGSKVQPQEIGTLELTEIDLNLAGNYLLNRYIKSAVHIQLKNNKMRFNVTVTLPGNPFGKYLNVSFRLGNQSGRELPVITKFKVGKLLMPAKLATFIIDSFIQRTYLKEYFILATRPIKTVRIDEDKIVIAYKSSAETLQQARQLLTKTTENPQQSIYQRKLADIIANHDPEWRLSLAELLQPMFELAYRRSTPETAVEENRLVILTVNEYVNKQGAADLIAQKPVKSRQANYYSAFMYKRIDLAQHFIASAAITASVNGQLAKVVGEQKELSDADGGSGFSFIDLAADKAGTRFGEIATSTPENACKIQKAMASIKNYSDFMPDPRDLPEKMDAEEFKARYGEIGSPLYNQVLEQINQRIDATPIYQYTGQ